MGTGKNEILEYLKAHKQEMKQLYHLEKIGLFGSFAKDTQHFGSDIDLLIKFDTDYIKSCDPWEYFNNLNKIKSEIKGHFMVNVDMVDEESDSPYLPFIKQEVVYV
jgi:predicted nucleotidyltransferase